MFVDASAFCAILLGEAEAVGLAECIARTDRPITSAIAVWETARALVREQGVEVSQALEDVEALLDRGRIAVVAIGAAEHRLALKAFDRFGKGRHPAALNMGDCFAYACARAQGVPLLYKGEDFSRTDIED